MGCVTKRKASKRSLDVENSSAKKLRYSTTTLELETQLAIEDRTKSLQEEFNRQLAQARLETAQVRLEAAEDIKR